MSSNTTKNTKVMDKMGSGHKLNKYLMISSVVLIAISCSSLLNPQTVNLPLVHGEGFSKQTSKTMYHDYNRNATISKSLEKKVQSYSGAMVGMSFLRGDASVIKDSQDYFSTLNDLKSKIGTFTTLEDVYDKLGYDYKGDKAKADKYVSELQTKKPSQITDVDINQQIMMVDSDVSIRYFYNDNQDYLTALVTTVVHYGAYQDKIYYNSFNFDSTGSPMLPYYLK